MKKLLLACCLGATLATAAYAGPGMPTAADRLEHLQKSLQLSEAQTQKIKPLIESEAQQRAALAEKYKISEFKAFREEMKGVHEQTRSKIAAVLTPQQREAMEAQHEHKGRRFHKMRDHDGPDCHGPAPVPVQP